MLVTAAFIGPGTALNAGKAEASHGFSLFWAVIISFVATVVLQEMGARLEVISGGGLALTVRKCYLETTNERIEKLLPWNQMLTDYLESKNNGTLATVCYKGEI